MDKVGRYTQFDNVVDLNEYRMHKLIDLADERSKPEVAEQLLNALDHYLLGNIDLVFIHGWPYTVAVKQHDITEETDEDLTDD